MPVGARAADVSPSRRRGGAPPRAPGLLMGVGLGGFVDGIVLHQILQWHHMLTGTGDEPADTVAGLEANTLADGLFHAAMWLVTAVGIWWLWRNVSRRRLALDRQLLGWAIAGWGAFNVVDEIVFHALLDLHHIREGGNELAYDMAFLALGLAQIAFGAALARVR